MKLKNKILVLSLFLVLICCLGAVSATEDINETVTADSSIDDVNTVEDTSDEIGSDASDNTDEIVKTQIVKDTNIETSKGIPVSASNWASLKTYSELTYDCTITLSGNAYTIGDPISFKNSATIIGTSNSYITGGSTSKTPFVNTNSALTLHFINVKFLNVNAQNLLELDGTVYIENCTFDNIQTATGHNSVIYNTNNYMYLTGCNITNCHTGYGAVSNYNSASQTSVVMYVDKCKFINNTAAVEPGAINNCGILYVNNSEFIGNHANWWAGAIHTHTNAQTYIENSIFRGNTAGWNGGALFTYSILQIYNSTFENNNCTTNNGGGAIGAYNYGSGYNITIDSCRFNNNINLCKAYDNLSTTSLGRGGAISVLNGGYLDVHNSNFTANYARIGQAIAAATYTYENGTGGNPHIKIYNNRFVNHTYTGTDTVVITGTDYIFNNNKFINSVQNTHYTGTGNTFNSLNPVLSILSVQNNIKSRLGASKSDILGIDMDNGQNIIYVNSSSENMFFMVDGLSWETAVGTPDSLSISINFITNDGIIHIAEGNYNSATINSLKNITFIGQGINTIIDINSIVYGNENNASCKYTFINLTFNSLDSCRDANFINCTFINPISIAKDFENYDSAHVEEYGYAKTYFMNFDNCVFKDVTTVDALVTLYKYGAVNFNNCTFENIVADSLVYHNDSSYFDDDSISFKNCTFTNCKFNGVVDSAANFDDAIVIEDCNYDGEVAVGTTEVNGHFYVNATKLKVVAVDTSIGVSSPEKGVVVISLKDNDNKTVVGAKVTYKVNGEDKENVTDANGEIRIALTGEGKITNITYAGNESYKPSNAPDFPYNFTQTTPTPDTNSSTNGTSTNSGSTNTNTNKQTNTKVTKKATKITAKKATFKAKKKTKKYSIVLKAGKAAVKKVKVTLKVGKKTYKATTNKKGKATFNLKKLTKKGKYTAVIKFAGNKLYKATTKKVKITVKK
ncbi:MAG: hypothetical protein IKF82_03800 [Bacilli bacterium]|nr:hypothetical protein [Methanobrevibacter sp.]MBR3209373.1 hypothetical protein [Bacilli bacterium]